MKSRGMNAWKKMYSSSLDFISRKWRKWKRKNNVVEQHYGLDGNES